MVSRQLSLRGLRGALREHGLRQSDLARAVGVSLPTMSAALRGDIEIGPERKAQIERAIAQLRLYEPVAPGDDEVIFTVPVEATE